MASYSRGLERERGGGGTKAVATPRLAHTPPHPHPHNTPTQHTHTTHWLMLNLGADCDTESGCGVGGSCALQGVHSGAWPEVLCTPLCDTALSVSLLHRTSLPQTTQRGRRKLTEQSERENEQALKKKKEGTKKKKKKKKKKNEQNKKVHCILSCLNCGFKVHTNLYVVCREAQKEREKKKGNAKRTTHVRPDLVSHFLSSPPFFPPQLARNPCLLCCSVVSGEKMDGYDGVYQMSDDMVQRLQQDQMQQQQQPQEQVQPWQEHQPQQHTRTM